MSRASSAARMRARVSSAEVSDAAPGSRAAATDLAEARGCLDRARAHAGGSPARDGVVAGDLGAEGHARGDRGGDVRGIRLDRGDEVARGVRGGVLAAAFGTGVRLVNLAQVHALELELLHRLLDSLVRLHLEVVDVALDALVERLLGDATEHLDRHGERGRSKIARCPLLDSRDRRRAGALTDAEGATGRSERGGCARTANARAKRERRPRARGWVCAENRSPVTWLALGGKGAGGLDPTGWDHVGKSTVAREHLL